MVTNMFYIILDNITDCTPQKDSLIVAGIPNIPDEILESDTSNAQHEEQRIIDWQLSITTAFFDRCTPNQPGFSSSVAAITVLPGSRQLAQAWNRWYGAAAALRQLRFIRSTIADQLVEKHLKSINHEIDEEQQPMLQHAPHAKRNIFKDRDADTCALVSQISSLTTEQKFNRVHELNYAVESQLLDALEYGPEQIAAYEREYALAASLGCACNNRSLEQMPLEELLDMERDALEDVLEANDVLKRLYSKLENTSNEEAIESADNLDIFHDNNGIEIKRCSKEDKDYLLDDDMGKNESAEQSSLKSTNSPKSSLTTRKRVNLNTSFIEKSLRNPKARRTFEPLLSESTNNLDTGRVQVDGNWNLRKKSTWRSLSDCIVRYFKKMIRDRLSCKDFHREISCAVVTFTNRQGKLRRKLCFMFHFICFVLIHHPHVIAQNNHST